MIYLFRYISHYFISNSRHGTHSPFVYSLADQVIYNKQYQPNHSINYPSDFNIHYLDLLHKILSYLGVSKLADNLNSKSAEVYWFDRILDEEFDAVLNLIDSGKIVIIDKPYSKYQYKTWKALIADQRVTVSINLFHFGILLKRDAQHKEDFLLRQS